MSLNLQSISIPCDCPYAKHANAVNKQEEAAPLEKITEGINNAEDKKTNLPRFDSFSYKEKFESIGIYQVQQTKDGKQIVFSAPISKNTFCTSGLCTNA